jgi:outer membrane protein TolC
MKLPASLTIALLAAASVRAEAPSIEGTLPEDYIPGLKPLLVMAVERSPSSIAASISVAQQEAGKISAEAPLWPSLIANANYASTTEKTSLSQRDSTSGLFYSASVTQPLFQWGALKNGAEVGALGVKIAERQYAEAYRLLAINIREQYLGLIQKKISLRNAQFALHLSQVSMKAQQARFDSGAASEAELGNYRMTVEQAQLDTDRAAEDMAYAKRGFTRLVGIESLDDESIPLEIPHPKYSAPIADAVLAGFVGDGIESTFQNQVYNMTLKQADANYSIAKVRLLPKVSASATYSYQDYVAASAASVSQVGIQAETYGISATWFIFDGFATRAAKMSALDSRRYYERIQKTYVDSTVDTVTYMRHQLDFSNRSMAFAEVHNALIAAEVKRLGDDVGLGYASEASVDSGKLTLYSTEYQMAYARSDYLGRWTEFISQAGIDPAIGNISPRYVR